MAVTDMDEWLRPEAARDEVTLEVDDLATSLVLRAALVITPLKRQANLLVTVDGARARHDAEEPGPPSSNWDRMRIGGVEWRMVEPLRRWELSVDDPDAGLRAYLAFSGSTLCAEMSGGYEQRGVVSGQLHLAGRLVSLSDVQSRRTHTWG